MPVDDTYQVNMSFIIIHIAISKLFPEFNNSPVKIFRQIFTKCAHLLYLTSLMAWRSINQQITKFISHEFKESPYNNQRTRPQNQFRPNGKSWHSMLFLVIILIHFIHSFQRETKETRSQTVLKKNIIQLTTKQRKYTNKKHDITKPIRTQNHKQIINPNST